MSTSIVISGSGLFTPPNAISNDEIVASFNSFVKKYNDQHQEDILAGKVEALQESDCAFIEKASGIKNRYVMDKKGILDPDIMYPIFKKRADEELSIQAEIGLAAAKQALIAANKTPADVDAIIVSCSNLQRAYPAISIEIQNALGVQGYSFDMSGACSSATFGLYNAYNILKTGQARCVLLITPEMLTPQVNFRDRQSHFIFGEAATALVLENKADAKSKDLFEIIDVKLKTQFSNNVRCNFGYMNHSEGNDVYGLDKMFYQQGKKVFKEVIPFVENFVTTQLQELKIPLSQLKRLWLHQANGNMNRLIATKILGHEPSFSEAPIILDEYANTASAGSIIAFHKHRQNLNPGDIALICSFGAGYSVGSVVVKKM